jgi:hypothetical protein
MLANTGIGWCVDRFGYGPAWMASGLMYPAAFGVMMLTMGARVGWASPTAAGVSDGGQCPPYAQKERIDEHQPTE